MEEEVPRPSSTDLPTRPTDKKDGVSDEEVTDKESKETKENEDAPVLCRRPSRPDNHDIPSLPRTMLQIQRLRNRLKEYHDDCIRFLCALDHRVHLSHDDAPRRIRKRVPEPVAVLFEGYKSDNAGHY
jgi:hypothetical protein